MPRAVTIFVEDDPSVDVSGCPESCYVILLPDLGLRIQNEAGNALARMVGDHENLDTLLDTLVDSSAYEGDWAALVRLRECLLKFVKAAESALSQIAEEGAYKDVHS